MSRFIDLKGRQFGDLLVTGLDRKEVKPWISEFYWDCICNCGTTKVVSGRALKSKNGTRSCGCSRRKPLTHGYCQDRSSEDFRLHRVWSQMIQRCRNPNDNRYNYYGARGIKVCKRWQGKNGFINFIEDMGSRPKGRMLERRNNNGNYTPSNCYWATRAEQARNTRQNVMIKYNGKTQCLKDWADELGINYKTLHLRIRRYGWTTTRAFSTPVKLCNR